MRVEIFLLFACLKIAFSVDKDEGIVFRPQKACCLLACF
jgi:hypothetical protein